MEDDDIILCNACTDLVSLKKNEAFPLRLLDAVKAGEWTCVRDFCTRVGVPKCDVKPELFAAWLADPRGDDAYAVILFYDDESQWSMAAHFNRGRILNRAVSPSTDAAEAGIAAASPVTTQQQPAGKR